KMKKLFMLAILGGFTFGNLFANTQNVLVVNESNDAKTALTSKLKATIEKIDAKMATADAASKADLEKMKNNLSAALNKAAGVADDAWAAFSKETEAAIVAAEEKLK